MSLTPKKIFVLFGILLLIIVVFLFARNYLKTHPFSILKSGTVTIDSQTFNVTIAEAEKDKEIGLSEKTSLPQNQGMLFPFDTVDYYAFWMKNMKLPIDIIYIKTDHIITLYPNVQPPSQNSILSIYRPDAPADTVLEINAGLSDKYGFKKGDEVKIVH